MSVMEFKLSASLEGHDDDVRVSLLAQAPSCEQTQALVESSQLITLLP